MGYNVFVDTNIILDIMLEREPFFSVSKKAILKIVGNGFVPYLSSSSVTDIYYISNRNGLDKAIILKKLEKLLESFEVLAIDKNSIMEAISSGLKDFEDAVQIMACKKGNIDLILTRNKKDFEKQLDSCAKPTGIPVINQ